MRKITYAILILFILTSVNLIWSQMRKGGGCPDSLDKSPAQLTNDLNCRIQLLLKLREQYIKYVPAKNYSEDDIKTFNVLLENNRAAASDTLSRLSDFVAQIGYDRTLTEYEEKNPSISQKIEKAKKDIQKPAKLYFPGYP
ncbi:MAG: hypothetical protein HY400_04385 [Elusimicrobia bacterium]|nr:hypothetical protein [Elusimicrobiota bacterium]